MQQEYNFPNVPVHIRDDGSAQVRLWEADEKTRNTVADAIRNKTAEQLIFGSGRNRCVIDLTKSENQPSRS